jgi:hypothetical protein
LRIFVYIYPRTDSKLVGGFLVQLPPQYHVYSIKKLKKTVKIPACSDTWIDLPDLNEEREGLALMNIQGTVMAVGGSIRGELLDIVETWDGEK